MRIRELSLLSLLALSAHARRRKQEQLVRKGTEPLPAVQSNWLSLVNQGVQNTILQDVTSVMQAFNDTTGILSQVALASLQLPLLQTWPEVPTSQFYESIASQIGDIFNSVVNISHSGFAPNGTDGYTFDDFQNCMSSLVLQGGLRTGETCIRNGATVTGLQNIYSNVLDQYNSILPPNIISALLQQSGQTYQSSIIPAAQEIQYALNNATLSVTASTEGYLVTATAKAIKCYQDAMFQGTYNASMEYACDHAPDGAFQSVEVLYQSIIGQFQGILLPNVIQGVIDIGASYLPLSTEAGRAAMYQQIHNALISVAASTGGNIVSLTGHLIDCLNYIQIGNAPNQTASDECLSSPVGAVALQANVITNGYIQQVYGYLPPNLALDLNQTIGSQLMDNSTDYNATSIRQQLDALFTASAAGPAYVSCYEAFEDCIVATYNKGSSADDSKSACMLQYACSTTRPNGNVPSSSRRERREEMARRRRENAKRYYALRRRKRSNISVKPIRDMF